MSSTIGMEISDMYMFIAFQIYQTTGVASVDHCVVVCVNIDQTLQEGFVAMEYNKSIRGVVVVIANLSVHIVKS